MENIEQTLVELKEICEKLQKVLTQLGKQHFDSSDAEKQAVKKALNDIGLYNRFLHRFYEILVRTVLQVKNIYIPDLPLLEGTNYFNFIEIDHYLFDSQMPTQNGARLSFTYPLDTDCDKALLEEVIKEMLYRLNWINKFLSHNNMIKKVFFDEIPLTYAIKYFSVTNFQCIHHIEVDLPVDAQFITFVGDNGDGKTSILQALGLGLYNSDALTDEDRGENIAIQVQYKEHENSWHNDVYTDRSKPILSSLRHKMHEVKPFACYGASRLKVTETKKLENPLPNLYPERAELANIFSDWLPRLSVNKYAQFEQVKTLLIKLLPNVSDIVKKNKNEIISDFLFAEKGKNVEFKHLSAGHKSIVLMIGDMLMRLAQAQPEIENPREFAGIVLIDELESHLHPRWQKEFPRILSETFPNVQFIVTTHSAITLLGMPRNTVFFKVSRTEEEGTQIERVQIDIENLLPNAIYTSPLFGLENIRSVHNKGIEQLNVEDSFPEILKNAETTQLLKSLATKYKPKTYEENK